MNTLELLIVDILNFNDQIHGLENETKVLKNLNGYLDKRMEQLITKRSYTLKFPFNLIHRNKIIVDDLNDPQEIEKYNDEVNEFNNLLSTTKSLEQHLKCLRIEIGFLADALTYDDYITYCENHHISTTKKDYNAIKNALRTSENSL